MPLDCGGLDGFSLSSFRHSLAFIRGIFEPLIQMLLEFFIIM